MELKTQDSPVIEKTKELCLTLLDQPSFHQIRDSIERFSQDEAVREQYNQLCDRQEMLQQKDGQGLPISDEEIEAFERERDELFANPIAKEFMDAQQALHKLQQTVGQYISKTFKLGRLPTDDDFETGSCGPNCGCSG